jgi:hypothetical protein
VFCALFFVFLCELAIIDATHHVDTLGGSQIIGMHVRIGTIPQALYSITSPHPILRRARFPHLYLHA